MSSSLSHRGPPPSPPFNTLLLPTDDPRLLPFTLFSFFLFWVSGFFYRLWFGFGGLVVFCGSESQIFCGLNLGFLIPPCYSLSLSLSAILLQFLIFFSVLFAGAFDFLWVGCECYGRLQKVAVDGLLEWLFRQNDNFFVRILVCAKNGFGLIERGRESVNGRRSGEASYNCLA